jgi:hypothetical protein
MSAVQCGRELGRHIEPHTAAAIFTQETPSSLRDQNIQKIRKPFRNMALLTQL